MINRNTILTTMCCFILFSSFSKAPGQIGEKDHIYDIPEDEVLWIKQVTLELLDGCRIKGADGTWLHTPDGVGHYKALWTREYYNMVNYAGDLMDPGEIKASIFYLLNGQREDGCIPDRVNVAGQPIYSSGPPGKPMADHDLDNGSFMAMTVCSYVNQYQDKALFLEVEPRLRKALKFTRLSDKGLVFNDPMDPQCVYGFTGGIKKTGNLLFCSLLFYKANLEMYLLCEKYQCGTPAFYKQNYERVQESISMLWDEDQELFMAADMDCRQPDIWGNAYAVAIGIATDQQSAHISEYLVNHVDEFERYGQIRHLPVSEGSWDNLWKPMPEGTFQNGAYWATPLAWVIPVIAKSDPELAGNILRRAISDFKKRGMHECVNADYVKVPKFVISATNVYGLTR